MIALRAISKKTRHAFDVRKIKHDGQVSQAGDCDCGAGADLGGCVPTCCFGRTLAAMTLP